MSEEIRHDGNNIGGHNDYVSEEQLEFDMPTAADKPENEVPDSYNPVSEETEFAELAGTGGKELTGKPRRKKAMTAKEMRHRIKELEAELENRSVKNWIKNESSRFDEHIDRLNSNLHLDLHGDISKGDNKKIAACLIGALCTLIVLLIAFVNSNNNTDMLPSYSSPNVTQIRQQNKDEQFKKQFANNIFAKAGQAEKREQAHMLTKQKAEGPQYAAPCAEHAHAHYNGPCTDPCHEHCSQPCQEPNCQRLHKPAAGNEDMIAKLRGMNKPFDPEHNIFNPNAKLNGINLQLPDELSDVKPVQGTDGSWTWQKNDGHNAISLTVNADGNAFSFSRECINCDGRPADVPAQTQTPAQIQQAPVQQMAPVVQQQSNIPAAINEDGSLELTYERYSMLPVDYRLALLAEHFNTNCRVIEYTLRSAAERAGAKTDNERVDAIRQILLTPDGIRTRQLYEIWDKAKDNKQVLAAIDTMIIENVFYGQTYNNAVETALMLIYQAQ